MKKESKLERIDYGLELASSNMAFHLIYEPLEDYGVYTGETVSVFV